MTRTLTILAKSLFLIAFITALIALPACGRRSKTTVVHKSGGGGHHGGTVVVIKKGHSHSAGCGHYKRHGKWYHWKGHHHKNGCGHAFVGGMWVVRD